MSDLRVTKLGREEEKGAWRPSRECAQGLAGCPSVIRSECMTVCVHLCKRSEKAVNKGGELVFTNTRVTSDFMFWG